MTVSTVVLSNAQKSLPTFRCGIDKQIKKQMSLEELTNSLGNATGIPERDKNTAASVRNLIALVELSGILTKDPSGSFSLNPDLNSSSRQAITVEDQRPIVLVRIANE